MSLRKAAEYLIEKLNRPKYPMILTFLILGFIALTVYNGDREWERITNAWDKILPVIERYDGKAGLSYNDQVLFAKKINVPTREVFEGKTIYENFDKVPVKDLEKFIESEGL